MKDVIKRSRTIEETAQSQKGMIWILELLVFVAVFFVSSIAMMFIITPAQMIAFRMDSQYMEAVSGGNAAAAAQAAMEASERIMSSDGYVIACLFADIMMILVICLFCRFFAEAKAAYPWFLVKKDMFKEYGIGMLLGFVFFFGVCASELSFWRN